MKYFAGIDGGGTKTYCVICDEKGIVKGRYKSAASNYQVVGSSKSKLAIKKAFTGALEAAELEAGQVEFVFLGLSGADEDYDFKELNRICGEIFPAIPFKVVNDTWICMRSALKQRWGVVSICGTGFNAAARNSACDEVILRAEGYELGNVGGGDHLARMALHYAFRADEETGSPTLLQTELPEALNAPDMAHLFTAFRQSEDALEDSLVKIPPLVFKLAQMGDSVCQKILIRLGDIMGEEVCGVIKRAGMGNTAFPVVLGGSIYNDRNTSPLLVDQLITAIHQAAPKAYLVFPALPPVAGALISALEESGNIPEDIVYANLEEALK